MNIEIGSTPATPRSVWQTLLRIRGSTLRIMRERFSLAFAIGCPRSIRRNVWTLVAGQVQLARRISPAVSEGDAIEFLRAHAAEYDLVTAFDVVEHFRKDELFDFLDALFGALRPEGRAIFQTPNAESPWGMAVFYGDLTHEMAFDPKSLSHALRED